jgi:TatA/E family protein of Tat protein translocase
MGALSPLHLVIVLVVALLVLGPGKLPETGAALGRAIREFRNAVDGTADAMATATAGVPVDASTPPPVPAEPGPVPAGPGPVPVSMPAAPATAAAAPDPGPDALA